MARLLATPRARSIGILLAALLAWQVGQSVLAPHYLAIPTPLAVLNSLYTSRASLLTHLLATSQEATLGFIVGVTAALLLAALSLASRSVEDNIFRLAVTLHSMPLIVVAPLLVIWFGSGLAPRVALGALACFFGVLVNGVRGFKAVHREGEELLHMLGAGKMQVFWLLRVPTCLPYALSALKVAAVASVLGAVVGEWIGAEKGLGLVLLWSLFEFDTPKLWAAMLLCTILAMSAYA